jgi:hypothetical protein
MYERNRPISPEALEAFIRHAHDERAAALATMMKRMPAVIAAAVQAVLLVGGAKNSSSRGKASVLVPHAWDTRS